MINFFLLLYVNVLAGLPLLGCPICVKCKATIHLTNLVILLLLLRFTLSPFLISNVKVTLNRRHRKRLNFILRFNLFVVIYVVEIACNLVINILRNHKNVHLFLPTRMACILGLKSLLSLNPQILLLAKIFEIVVLRDDLPGFILPRRRQNVV